MRLPEVDQFQATANGEELGEEDEGVGGNTVEELRQRGDGSAVANTAKAMINRYKDVIAVWEVRCRVVFANSSTGHRPAQGVGIAQMKANALDTLTREATPANLNKVCEMVAGMPVEGKVGVETKKIVFRWEKGGVSEDISGGLRRLNLNHWGGRDRRQIQGPKLGAQLKTLPV